MKKSFVLLLVFLSCSILSLSAQVNGDNDTIWTKQINSIDDIKFSPDNKKIFCLHISQLSPAGNRTWIFNTEVGDYIKQIDSTMTLLVDSARNRVYTTFLKKIYAWDIDTYEKFDYFDLGDKDIQQPTYSAKNNRIAAVMGYLQSAQYEGVIKVWDCVSGKIIFTKTFGYFDNPETGHSYPPAFIDVKFNDGLNILSIYVEYGDYRDENNPHGSSYISKKIFEVYDATTFEYKSDNPFLCNYFFMSESGKYVVIFARQQDGKDDMLVIQTSDFSEIARIPVIDREKISGLDISNDDKYLLYSWRNDYKARIYEMEKKSEIYYYPGMRHCDISSNNNMIISSTGSYMMLYKTPWYTSVLYENDIDAVISFPNPATDYININIGDVNLSEAKDIKIYNSLGECVLVEQTPPSVQLSSAHRINISALSPGFYFISINNGKDMLTGSFIVVR